MKVSVKTLDGKTTSYDVEPHLTIKELKEVISPGIGIDSDKIRLIFRGKVLVDTTTVLSNELDDVTVHAVERLPQPPPQTPSVDLPESSSGGQSVPAGNGEPAVLLGSLRGGINDFSQITDILHGIITSVNSSLGESRSGNTTTSGRMRTAATFIDHVESFLNPSELNPSPLSIDLIRRMPANPPPQDLSPSIPQTHIVRLSALMRRCSSMLSLLQPLVNTYIVFLDMASRQREPNQQLLGLSLSELYPTIPDVCSLMLHSAAHALHNISDILVYRSARPSSESGTEESFRLAVPTLAADLAAMPHGRRANSQTNASRNDPTVADVQNTQTNQNIPDAPNPQNTQTSSSNSTPATPGNSGAAFVAPSSAGETSSQTSGGNPGSIHLTLQLTTTGIFEANGETSQYFFLNNSQNPTATANSPVVVPGLIRTTAGGSLLGSSRNQNRDSAQPAPSEVPRDRSMSGSHRRRIEPLEVMSDRSVPIFPSYSPVDPSLHCRSLYSGSSSSGRVIYFPSGAVAQSSSAPAHRSAQQPTPTPEAPPRVQDLGFCTVTRSERHISDNPPQPSQARNQAVATTQTTTNATTPSTAAATTAPAVVSTHPTTTQFNRDGVQNWSTLFPPSTVPIIEADVITQKSMRKQPPFSDGYLCGSLDKRKKLQDQSHAVEFAGSELSDSFINHLSALGGIEADINGMRTAIENDAELQSTFNDCVRTSLANEVDKYTQINPDRFPHAADFRKQR